MSQAHRGPHPAVSELRHGGLPELRLQAVRRGQLRQRGSPAGPPGSTEIEKQLVAFNGSRGLPTVGTDFDGRSDYGPFIAVGIPAGGIFTGAEGIKTAAEAALFGGTAGVPNDACYHQACDTIANIDATALDVDADAIADSAARYAFNLRSIPPRVAPATSRARFTPPTSGLLDVLTRTGGKDTFR
ncbi:M28 family peptidase [Nonomuraea aurantiaca]|uniref:M28 family peptidase n=1 Tax=Nonomuraea aurantiaca TaxID=2878562 RepID=UPI001CD962B6|nr:M28 family peptidase [Nonomuraea aurantiaca]MCA2226155.1 M28 family peptidase [Nonomuraea aurantiaca]